jgi:hypothetical protein
MANRNPRKPNPGFDPTSESLTIQFASPESAAHFKSWLCEQGESDYWLWMDYREEEQNGDITATNFEYHGDDPNIIKTKCGRLDSIDR